MLFGIAIGPIVALIAGLLILLIIIGVLGLVGRYVGGVTI